MYASWLSRIHARLDSSPAVIDAVIPCRVVPRQNSSITSAGRLALAAMLKAQPTRKFTFILANRMPNAMATIPTHNEAIFAARTCLDSSIFISSKLVIRSCATAPLAAMIRPLTVPRMVVNATAERTANTL